MLDNCALNINQLTIDRSRTQKSVCLIDCLKAKQSVSGLTSSQRGNMTGGWTYKDHAVSNLQRFSRQLTISLASRSRVIRNRAKNDCLPRSTGRPNKFKSAGNSPIRGLEGIQNVSWSIGF